MRRFFVFLLTAALTLGLAATARAQTAVTVTEVQMEYLFGDHVTFAANVQPASGLQETLVFFQAEGDSVTRVAPLEVAADGSASSRIEVRDAPLRPFARVSFWFRITPAGGEAFTSPHYFFHYTDNRVVWQTLEDASVSIHWYDGDAAFGQAAFDTAHASLQAFNELIPVTLTAPVNVYIYATAADLQSAIGAQAWVAGHASPDLGVALTSITPGEEQMLVMQRQIPHEMAHVLLYQKMGAAYNNLPTWLSEGIASSLELYPNSDYMLAIQIASQNDALLPLADLCGPFPQDASGAFLAYAESDRVTRYILDTYGTSGLQALVQAYTDGLDCNRGVERALGISLVQLDRQWRWAVLGEGGADAAFENLLPYLVVLTVILAVPAWGGLAIKRKREDGTRKRK
ncbi:MAG: hypothetical protein FD146_872 [Anaerolineaceae bacterium]|nr:MAG: hypothetical protein FD146_872 [Anaerolineaceae bacterium]